MSDSDRKRSPFLSVCLAGVLIVILSMPSTLQASDTLNPSSVTVVGSLQSELGCGGDWNPGCAATSLSYDAVDGVWQSAWTIPTGSWEYKAALNNSWDENYGANAARNGSNIGLNVTASNAVKFYYDHETHWITDNQNAVIATVPGSFQSELGCSGDWQPDCLQSWLQDPDGDGVYTFTTNTIPAGSYEAKVAINESWAENYGQGGARDSANIPFIVAAGGRDVTFTYNATTHILTISSGPNQDNNVEYSGLGHNSQDTLYRVPFGAITPGTELLLRFRTYHNDVTGVRVRVWDGVAGGQFFLEMELAASDVSCYNDSQPDARCDFWQAAYTPTIPTTLYYRFIVSDGTSTAYYDDDAFQDGGWGEVTSSLQDDSYVVTVYDLGYEPVEWMQNGVVYQIFPDRFRNGRNSNDPSPDALRYGYPDNALDQIITLSWGELPEGYCRHYTNPAEPCDEGPRGRDYFGGDLRGVMQRLNYLESLGVTVIYFNPVFDAGSNHAYDTQNYYQIDPFFGTNAEFQQLVREAERRGIRIVLDGVFNHVSSDSSYFDRYGHYAEVGACESIDSPYRVWFTFRPQAGGPCAGPNGPNTMTYDSWFGFDSLPVLDKTSAEVQNLVYASDDAVARYWLNQGVSGWRLDVMGDPSFPFDFWPEFRTAVRETNPNAVIIGELWKKHETLPLVRGNGADTAMNYRFRNAILGFFGTIDHKGFVDDGQSNQPPSLFVRKLMSVREDYPDAAYYTMLNILDSHDTERILWSLTPGAGNREGREFHAANLEYGKNILELASVVQMTTPGAPTLFYGDEVGVTGADDPDDRRTFPWNPANDEFYGVGGDTDLLQHYMLLTDLRHNNPVFRQGELIFLLADDTNYTLAYLLRTEDAAALVAINRSGSSQTLHIDTSGLLPDGVQLSDALGTVSSVSASGGVLTLEMPALSASILLPEAGQDLTAPAAPASLTASEGANQVGLTWSAVPDAAKYVIYRSPLTRGGYVAVGETSDPFFSDTTAENARRYYYVVAAVDAAGNEGAQSNEARAQPHYSIGWANLQWPPSLTVTLGSYSDPVYGQVWIDGATSQPGPTLDLIAQVGFGPTGSNPAGSDWLWVDAAFNVDVGNNDEFAARLLPTAVGEYDYVYRYSTTNGSEWLYADLSGPVSSGALPANPGRLTVHPSADTTPPAAPSNLRVTGFAPNSIALAWDAHPNLDGDLAGFEIYRENTAALGFTRIGTIFDASATSYTDSSVVEGTTYHYYIAAFDSSFNRSGPSNIVTATASLRTVTVTFIVTAPGSTPAGSTVYIAGTLQRLDGGLPEWNPSGVALTQIGPHQWSITLSGAEGTTIEYKYTLGSWDYVEKGVSCEEIGNRTLTLIYGADGQQTVSDTVANWRNVPPCGN